MTEYLKRVYGGTREEFFSLLAGRLADENKTFIVTANPEVLMNGGSNAEYGGLLLDESTLITPDGIGVVKAASAAGIPVKERITGVDIVTELLRIGSEKGLSVYFYGAKPEVLSALAAVIKKDYPGITVAGMRDGYSNDDEAVFDDIAAKKPDITVVALGVPRQELLIYRQLARFSKGVFIGAGGSLDVISGTKKRAPEFFIRHNCEWLYRIVTEPSRLRRFINGNVRFVFKIKKETKEVQK